MKTIKWILPFVSVIALLMSSPCYAQLFAKTYGGSNWDQNTTSIIKQTSDGGYVVGSYTSSFGAGAADFWVFKFDSAGDIIWQYSYGGTQQEFIGGNTGGRGDLQQTSDGGFIVVGSTDSFGMGNHDMWALKLNSNGTIAWQKTYGGINLDVATCVDETSDGGYIVAGQTPEPALGSLDACILKLNNDGSIAWQKQYRLNDYQNVFTIQQTSDGGYILGGGTVVSSDWDMLVLKLNSNGTIAWQKSYGGSQNDWVNCIQQTSDGGYIMTGIASSFTDNLWVLKLNSNGTIAWQKTYGGPWGEVGEWISQTADGGYIVGGTRKDPLSIFNDDLWALRLTSSGGIIWEKTYGEPGVDDMEHNAWIEETSDGGFILSGGTQGFGAGGLDQDLLVLRLDSQGQIPDCFIVADSSANVTNTYDSPVNLSGSIVNSDLMPANTYITPQQTSAEILEICSTTAALDELAIDFVGTNGVWDVDTAGTWRLISGGNVETMAGWANGLAMDFVGTSGVWNVDGTTWSPISGSDVETMVGWANGLAMDFGAAGVWNVDTAGMWTPISGNAETMAAWAKGLALDFGAAGVWNVDTAGMWTPISGDAEAMTGWANGLALDFGAAGVWNVDTAGTWTPISGNAETMAGWANGLALDFGALGVWNVDTAGTWTPISADAEIMVGWAKGLAMDFGPGIWNVDTAWTWSPISSGACNALTDVDLY